MAKIPERQNRASASSKLTGADYEQRARRWLEQQGLRFIAGNVYAAGGEIDLIMQHQQVTVFVEVRYRHGWQFGGAAASVSYAKQKKLLHAARGWLMQQCASFDTVDCRFDVLAFTANEVQWIQNAFS